MSVAEERLLAFDEGCCRLLSWVCGGGWLPSGSNVMIPKASFAWLYSLFSILLTPPPNEIEYEESRPS